MPEHKYTLSEIDRMRAAIGRKIGMPQTISYIHKIDGQPGRRSPESEAEWDSWRRRTEDELRTCVVAGITPDELEAAYPPSNSCDGISNGPRIGAPTITLLEDLSRKP